MSKCSYYHCEALQACKCYGWCAGHRASLATWACNHLSAVSVVLGPGTDGGSIDTITKTIQPIELIEPEESDDDVSPIKTPIEAPQEAPQLSEFVHGQRDNMAPEPILNNNTLPYYLDKIEETNEPQELIEQLALQHTEYAQKIELEMQAMREKLAKYEEDKKILAQIESKTAQLEQLEKKTLKPVVVPRVAQKVGPKIPLSVSTKVQKK
jgi:hypothetical protein